jgi:hypothetical protein
LTGDRLPETAGVPLGWQSLPQPLLVVAVVVVAAVVVDALDVDADVDVDDVGEAVAVAVAVAVDVAEVGVDTVPADAVVPVAPTVGLVADVVVAACPPHPAMNRTTARRATARMRFRSMASFLRVRPPRTGYRRAGGQRGAWARTEG